MDANAEGLRGTLTLPRLHEGFMPNRFRFLCRAVAASLVGVLAVTAHGQGQVADDDQLTPPRFAQT